MGANRLVGLSIGVSDQAAQGATQGRSEQLRAAG